MVGGGGVVGDLFVGGWGVGDLLRGVVVVV